MHVDEAFKKAISLYPELRGTGIEVEVVDDSEIPGDAQVERKGEKWVIKVGKSCAEMDKDELLVVFAHELAHILVGAEVRRAGRADELFLAMLDEASAELVGIKRILSAYSRGDVGDGAIRSLASRVANSAIYSIESEVEEIANRLGNFWGVNLADFIKQELGLDVLRGLSEARFTTALITFLAAAILSRRLGGVPSASVI